MSTIDVGKDINLLRKFDLITLNIVLRKIHEITEPGCGFPFDCFVTSVLLPQKDFPQFSAWPLTQVLQLWKLLSISTNGRPSLLPTLKLVTFTVQNSKGSCSQISTKENHYDCWRSWNYSIYERVVDLYVEAKTVLYAMFSCSKRSYPELAHPPRAAYN